MIVPSIDLMNGAAVQLRNGREKVLEAGDPRPLARRFGVVGEVAVIDLDAALSQGSNAAVVEDLLPLARCRVGGGIRDVESARRWLDAGAAKVILGTAATPEVLSRLPRERVIAALDAYEGEVVTHGWRTRTGAGIAERMRELRPYVSGFLVTFVETEGTLAGLDLARAAALREAAGDAALTVAGGIADAAEIGALDRLGIDAQVGMALYTGRFGVAEALGACMRTEAPWPTVVADERGRALGLAYSNAQSLGVALREGRGVYWSRRRGLWRKGETSGNTQELLRVDADCDRDALRFTVRARGPHCHRGTRDCFGEETGLGALERRLRAIADAPPAGSYTARLFGDPLLLAGKLREEAGELAQAAGAAATVEEAADVLYFTIATLASRGVRLEDVERELDRRALRVSRRGGDLKPQQVSAP